MDPKMGDEILLKAKLIGLQRGSGGSFAKVEIIGRISQVEAPGSNGLGLRFWVDTEKQPLRLVEDKK